MCTGAPALRKGGEVRNLVLNTIVQRVIVVLHSALMTYGNSCDFFFFESGEYKIQYSADTQVLMLSKFCLW